MDQETYTFILFYSRSPPLAKNNIDIPFNDTNNTAGLTAVLLKNINLN